jgi:hypothetical protein
VQEENDLAVARALVDVVPVEAIDDPILLIKLRVDRIVLGLMLGPKARVLRCQSFRAHRRIDLSESRRQQTARLVVLFKPEATSVPNGYWHGEDRRERGRLTKTWRFFDMWAQAELSATD